MHCNGHCYLSKQLKKAEEGENKSTQVLKEKEEIISNKHEQLPATHFPVYSFIKIYPVNSILYISDNANALVKPPAA